MLHVLLKHVLYRHRRDVFKTQLKIYDGAFCKINLCILALNYFCKKNTIIDIQLGSK